MIQHAKMWPRGATFILAVVFLVLVSVAHARVSYVEVETRGDGSTQNIAIASALREAVLSVNGGQLAGVSESAQATLALDTEDGSSVASSSMTSEAIATQTEGVVDSYTLLEASEEQGLWSVKLRARVAKYEVSAQAERLRMAVMPFRLMDSDQASFELAMTDALTTSLTQSRRFAMLDRDFLEEQSKELGFVASGGAATPELARLGNRLGTDYLIVGRIERANLSERTIELSSTGQSRTITTASADLSYRIIDVATTQIKYSDRWQGSGRDLSLSQLARRGGSEIGETILNAIFPIMVASYSNNTVTLGQGGNDIQIGDRYRLVQYGEPIVDPYTQESLGREERSVGVIEITSVQAKLSNASVIETTVDLGSQFRQGDFIVRPMEASGSSRSAGSSQAKSAEATAQDGKEAVDEMTEEMEDVW
jgi:curli biogenesis system outer membrane secretion channel CsgG